MPASVLAAQDQLVAMGCRGPVGWGPPQAAGSAQGFMRPSCCAPSALVPGQAPDPTGEAAVGCKLLGSLPLEAFLWGRRQAWGQEEGQGGWRPACHWEG